MPLARSVCHLSLSLSFQTVFIAQALSLLCGFCSPDQVRGTLSRTFALRLPSDRSSLSRPCLKFALLLVFITMNTLGFSYKGLSPHKLMSMTGVYKQMKRMALSRAYLRRSTDMPGVVG
jgi:hypothetical protein